MTATRRLPLLAAAAALAAVAFPAAAEAATVRLDRGAPIRYDAAPGEANLLKVTYGTRSVVLRDSGALISETGDGRCRARADRHSAICPMTRVYAQLGDRGDSGTVGGRVTRFVSLAGGDGDDRLEATASATGRFGIEQRGGAGDDDLLGGPGSDALDGGGGRDELLGRAGEDFLRDGDGYVFVDEDGFEARPPTTVDADAMDGGTGFDRVMYDRIDRPNLGRRPGVTVDLADEGPGHGEPGENDRLFGFEAAVGGSGDDTLLGDGGRNELWGNGGDDDLDGRAGGDDLNGGHGVDGYEGGSGNDRLGLTDYADRASERAACGTGFDYAIGTWPGDVAEASCERARPLGRGVDHFFGIELRTLPVTVDEATGVLAFRVLCRARSRYSGCRGRLAVAPGTEGRPDTPRPTAANYGTRGFRLAPGRWSTVRVRLDAAGRAALRASGERPFEVQVRRVRSARNGGGNTRSAGYTTRF